MKVAIMQPYLFPYLGYYQLVHSVDQFVFYDDANFINRGWVNRNNILSNNKSHLFTIPLKKISQNKLINEVTVENKQIWKERFFKTLYHVYKKAPFYEQSIQVIDAVLSGEDESISAITSSSIIAVANYLGLKTDFMFSSQIPHDKTLKGQAKIIAMCEEIGAATYINPINGMEMYNKPSFNEKGIDLFFIKMDDVYYSQFKKDNFVSNLSIIDVLMFSSKDKITSMLTKYKLL